MANRVDFQIAVDDIYDALREMMRDDDPHALRNETQETLVSLLIALGKLLLHAPDSPLPELHKNLVIAGARHAGNKVLAKSGTTYKENIALFEKSKNTDYKTMLALSCLYDLAENFQIQIALAAYWDDAEEDSDEREQMKQAAEEFQTIARSYSSEFLEPVGMRMLLWAARHTDVVKRIRADVHPELTVPWFINPAEYDRYEAAACTS